MNPLPTPKDNGPKEHRIQSAIRAELHKLGWTLCEKTAGSVYVAGFPDLMLFNPTRPPDKKLQWAEIKRRKGGKLTRAQKARFPAWEEAGLGIWILCGVEDIPLLDGPANWRDFATRRCHA